MNEVYLFLVCFACICIHAQIFDEDDYLNDHHPFYLLDGEGDARHEKHQIPELIRQQSGTNMVLKCIGTPCHSHKHKLIWQYKACHSDFKKISCTSFYEASNNVDGDSFKWNSATGHLVKKKCGTNLHIPNVTENHSGLYRCSNHNKIIKIYEVVVKDYIHRYSGQPPELIDVIPSNITIMQNMQVIIQCKVYSQQPPVIWWFKQSDGTNYDIQYYDKFYHRLNTTVQVYAIPYELNVYLSKLNIYHAQEEDTGVYVCVAMTESGKDYKDVIIKVIRTDQYWETHSSFIILFLIPISFGLIPVTIWLCYYRKKKKNGKKNANSIPQERCLIGRERSFVNDNTVV